MKNSTNRAYIVTILSLFAALIGIIYYIIAMDQHLKNGQIKSEKPIKTNSVVSHSTPKPRSSPLQKEKEFIENEFYTENFEPTGVFSALWAYDEKNVFIGGMNGTIMKYDGKKIVMFKGEKTGWIFKMAGRSPNEVYAACQDGILLKFNGTKWEKFHKFSEKIRLKAIWIPENSKEIFVAGDYGNIFHFDGKNWSKMETNTRARVWNMWGTSPDNIYATIHEEGGILHYNGRSWKKLNIPGYENCYFYSVYGFSKDNFYIGGDTGYLLKYNGKEWSKVNYNLNSKKFCIFSISGTSQEDLYFCDYYGKIIHWNGKTAKVVNKQQDKKCFYEVYSINNKNVYSIGDDGVINHFDGRQWKRLSYGNPKLSKKKESKDNDLQFVNNGRNALINYRNHKWIPHQGIEGVDMVGVWGTSKDNVFAVGEYGTILHYDGIEWHKEESIVSTSLFCIRGISANKIFACGLKGVILEYDGRKWKKIETGTQKPINSLWIATEKRGFAVGMEGIILQYDGRTWKHAVAPELVGHINFSDIWGFSEDNVYAIGDLGTIYHYNGKDWRKIPTSTSKWLLSAWGSDRHNLFIGAEDGLILHIDGDEVTEMNAGTITCIFGLWGSSANNVYGIAGDGGAIVHYDGKKWKQIAYADGYLCDIWGTGENSFFIVGEGKE